MGYRVSEMEGALLDLAVAKAEGRDLDGIECSGPFGPDHLLWLENESGALERYLPSSAWEDGGPIIEREHISVDSRGSVTVELSEPQALWMAYIHDGPQLVACGPTPLVAAMRLYVLVKFGETVDLP